MAFIMYAGGDQESIDHHEEFILDIAARNPNTYPELNKIRDAIYSDPILHDEQAESTGRKQEYSDQNCCKVATVFQ